MANGVLGLADLVRFHVQRSRRIFPEPEGTAFCEILSNSFNAWQNRLHGDILLNGVSVSPARLQDRVAYVRRNNAFGADMSVRQTMLFHSFLREPGTHARSRDARGRVSNSCALT